MIAALWKEAGVAIPTPFPRMKYADAVERYGTDRPDLRYGLEIFDATEIFRAVDFGITRGAIEAGGRVRGIRIPGGAALSRKQVDELETLAKSAGAAGMLRLKREKGELSGPAAKFLSTEQAAALAIAEGDLCLLVACARSHLVARARSRASGSGEGTASRACEHAVVSLGARFSAVREGRGHRSARCGAPSLHVAAPRRSRVARLGAGEGARTRLRRRAQRHRARRRQHPYCGSRGTATHVQSAWRSTTRPRSSASASCSRGFARGRLRTAESRSASIASRCCCRARRRCATSLPSRRRRLRAHCSRVRRRP